MARSSRPLPKTASESRGGPQGGGSAPLDAIQTNAGVEENAGGALEAAHLLEAFLARDCLARDAGCFKHASNHKDPPLKTSTRMGDKDPPLQNNKDPSLQTLMCDVNDPHNPFCTLWHGCTYVELWCGTQACSSLTTRGSPPLLGATPQPNRKS